MLEEKVAWLLSEGYFLDELTGNYTYRRRKGNMGYSWEVPLLQLVDVECSLDHIKEMHKQFLSRFDLSL